jgi:hypothetical protein
MLRRNFLLAWCLATIALGALAADQGPAPDFLPDSTFRGSSLTGWHTLGPANWMAHDGEITGVAAPGAGGWLVLDKSYQDLDFFSRVRCTGNCRMGVLFRLEKTAAGMTGVYVSLSEGDLATYRLTLDAQGGETARQKLRPVGPFVRVAPTDPSGRRGRIGSTGAGRGGSPMNLPVTLPALMPPDTSFHQNDWNRMSVTVDADVIRPTVNQGFDIDPGATDDHANGYGPVALHVGAGEAHFTDVSFKDLHSRVVPAEKTSSRFRMQRLDEFYYAWGAAVADFNRDGILDVVAGPFYYLGPDYTTRREIYVTPTFNPSTQFPGNMIDFAWDFTGDGWPDVLAGESRPMALYVNPRGENRRWARYPVLPQITSELAILKDLDGDGQPEVIFGMGGVGGTIAYAKPSPTNPTAPWIVHPISEPGLGFGHSLGAGDINGDGRVDILAADGWWEQPPPGGSQGLWTYHPEAFGRWGRSEGAGGAELLVYDVNGDGLNDVVTSLNAHGWGLAWFEQHRDKGGRITFERHMIMDDYSTTNAGGVTFSEMHASALADIDGDGIPDVITGKRSFSHLESYTDADPYGAPVLYWFRTVRNPKAPGGAEFVPELIHNRSGVGSQFAVADLNGDGAVDIITSTNRGTFIFWGQPKKPARK